MLFTRCRGLMETWLRHLLVIAGLMWAIPGLAAEQELFFESHVRPMLKAHCFHCHGEADTRESNLDLRLVHWIIRGGDNGPALTPAAADTSLLWQKIESDEMPPKGKGLSDSEKAIVRKWIEQGARTRRPEPDSLEAANAWTEEDRSYWAFQPPKRPTLPEPQQADLATSAIDRFLLAALEPVGLSLSPEADRSTLVRRVSFDLLGLPPTPELTAQFLSDESPDAYQRLVERLLASPAYGERWARHWLDTAGYADSDGYSEKDTVRPWAFRYRDYVIRSLNDSKPLDEWIVEQLAGDELLKPPYENLSPTDTDKLIATGFLRMAPDGTEDGGVEATLARNDVIAETIKIVSTSLLGLTVGCAQCHDHRYDPISQQDYYRFRAIFEPVFDTKNWRSKSARLVNIQSPSERQLAAQVDAELKVLEARQTDELDCIVEQIFDRELAKLPEDKQAAAMVARETKNSQRSPEQLQLLKDYPSLKVDRGSAYLYEAGRLKDFNKRWDELKAAKRAERPADQAVACATEVPGQVPTTYVFLRGDANQPKAAVEPGNLSILPATGTIPVDDDYVPTSGRRLALARNLTSGQHPLLTRVLVNRIWMHHFGAGLVNTPGDFGALGERPSHAELLDWLATELVQQNWDLKSLQRTILLSRAYRQQSIKTPQQQSIDPDNRLLSRMNIRRLEAETIRDAMIEVAGLRTMSMFGPPAPVNPDEVGQFIVGSATRDGNGIMVAKLQDDPEQYRRSIYVQVRRSMPLSMLEPFDLATLSPNCDRRSSSTVAPQSLLLMNNQVALTLAERFAHRLIRDVGDDPRLQIQRAWRLAYGFEASDSTVMRALEFMAVEREHFEKQAAEKTAQAPPKETAKDKKATGAEPAELPPGTQALALLCQAILSSNQFLYVD